MISRSAAMTSRAPRRYSSTAASRSPGTPVRPGPPRARATSGAVSTGWRLPATGRPSAPRTRWPLMVQPAGRAAAARRSARASRPSNSGARSTSTPLAASWARASRKRCRPWSPAVSHATARWGRSPRILSTRWVSTRPGPDSTKTRAPAAYMDSISSTQRTGSATWFESNERTSSTASGYGAAVVFDHTGKAGGATRAAATASPRATRASATTGLWKAQATGRRLDLRPASARAATATSTDAVGPEMTAWPGALSLARTTGCSAGRVASTARTSSPLPATAAMAPGSSPAAPRMARARVSLRGTRSSSARAPAAQRATSSP